MDDRAEADAEQSPPVTPPNGRGLGSSWIVTGVLGVVVLGLLVVVLVLVIGDDGGTKPTTGRTTTTRKPSSATTRRSTAGKKHAGSARSTTTTTAPTTTTTSGTAPAISYLTAPASIACQAGETERLVDVTVRAERVTKLVIAGDRQAPRELLATAPDASIVGTVRMGASCSTTSDFVVTATGTDGSTVDRHVTVVGRVRPPASGS